MGEDGLGNMYFYAYGDSFQANVYVWCVTTFAYGTKTFCVCGERYFLYVFVYGTGDFRDVGNFSELKCGSRRKFFVSCQFFVTRLQYSYRNGQGVRTILSRNFSCRSHMRYDAANGSYGITCVFGRKVHGNVFQGVQGRVFSA